MSKNNNNTNLKENQYRHLTKEDRIKIESLISQKMIMVKDYLIILILLNI